MLQYQLFPRSFGITKEVQAVIDCFEKEYDKVKSPKRYVASIPGREDIVQIYVNGNIVWTSKEKEKFWDQN